MNRNLYAAILLAAFISPGYAIDQWPGQSDFSNLNGPVKNTDIFGQTPDLAIRFNPPNVKPWKLPPSPSSQTTLTPAQYSYCRHYQTERPTRDISCAGLDLP